MWDIVMALVGVLFAYSLIPTVIGCIKSRNVEGFVMQTLITTTIGMAVTEMFYLSNGMWWAFCTSAVTLICWALLTTMKLEAKYCSKKYRVTLFNTIVTIEEEDGSYVTEIRALDRETALNNYTITCIKLKGQLTNSCCILN